MSIEIKNSLDLEELGLKSHETVNIGYDKEVHSIKLELKDDKGRMASIISAYKDKEGNYNISHRETKEKFQGIGLASLLLKKMEDLIQKNLQNRRAILYLTANQKSVMKWMGKNGYGFENGEPDLSKEEIHMEQDGDIFYVNRFKLTKALEPLGPTDVDHEQRTVSDSVSSTMES